MNTTPMSQLRFQSTYLTYHCHYDHYEPQKLYLNDWMIHDEKDDIYVAKTLKDKRDGNWEKIGTLDLPDDVTLDKPLSPYAEIDESNPMADIVKQTLDIPNLFKSSDPEEVIANETEKYGLTGSFAQRYLIGDETVKGNDFAIPARVYKPIPQLNDKEKQKGPRRHFGIND
jgi:hypothetical protein